MTTSVIITGQISSIFAIRNKMGGGFEETNLPFNGKKLTYKTKKEAVQAIREAYQDLKFEEPDLRWPQLAASTNRDSLRYDAGTAQIETN